MNAKKSQARKTAKTRASAAPRTAVADAASYSRYARQLIEARSEDEVYATSAYGSLGLDPADPDAMILLQHVPNPSSYGVAVLDDGVLVCHKVGPCRG